MGIRNRAWLACGRPSLTTRERELKLTNNGKIYLFHSFTGLDTARKRWELASCAKVRFDKELKGVREWGEVALVFWRSARHVEPQREGQSWKSSGHSQECIGIKTQKRCGQGKTLEDILNLMTSSLCCIWEQAENFDKGCVHVTRNELRASSCVLMLYHYLVFTSQEYRPWDRTANIGVKQSQLFRTI